MAATFTLSGDLATIVGANIDPKAVEVYVEASEPAITDTTAHVTRVGSVKATVNTDGTWEAPGLLATNATDIIPAPVGGETFKYRVLIRYRDARTVTVKNLATGWFDLTANLKFDAIDERQLTQVDAAFADGIIDQVQASVDAAVAAKTAAQTAATAAQAVGTIADDQIAGRINTPGSATATALANSTADLINALAPGIVAANPTAVQAAANAVATALATAGTFTGYKQAASLEDLGLVFTDPNGYVAVWPSTTADGGPLPEAIAIVLDEVSKAQGVKFTVTDALGLGVAFTDPNGYAALVITDDGKVDLTLSDKALQEIVATVLPQVPTTAEYFKPRPTDTATRIASGPDWNIQGDSLYASGNAALGVVDALPGTTVRTSSVGGEKAFGIAARANAIPYLMRPVDSAGNTLTQWPATGSVDVRFSTALPGGNNNWPLLQGTGTSGTARGSLAGGVWDLTIRVKDSLVAYPSHGDGDIYQLTRVDTGGSAAPYVAPVPFLYQWAQARRGDITLINMGQNNSGADLTVFGSEIDGILAAIEATINSLASAAPKYLITTQTAADSTGWTDLEKAVVKRHGRRFCNVRRWFIDEGFAYAGVTPDADNLSDISIGRVPRYFRRINNGELDPIHFNSAAERMLGRYLFAPRAKELEYV